MQKIIPHLWFDTQAKEAAQFYVNTFQVLGTSNVVSVTTLHDTPSGDADSVIFDLAGYRFMAISAGPYFTLNPSISFMVNFDPSRDPQAEAHLHTIWDTLAADGEALMELGEYPFSKLYGWVKDKYGVTWQLMLTKPEGEERPIIIPSILFTEAEAKAEAASDFYLSVFKDSRRGALVRYPEGMPGAEERAGMVMFTDFMLEGQWFSSMDGGTQHDFSFNEAISLVVRCEDQAEIDYYWEKLSAVPESEQCGWLKDKYGVSWQVTPTVMEDMMRDGTPEQIQRVTQVFLQMKKFDIAALEEAYRG